MVAPLQELCVEALAEALAEGPLERLLAWDECPAELCDRVAAAVVRRGALTDALLASVLHPGAQTVVLRPHAGLTPAALALVRERCAGSVVALVVAQTVLNLGSLAPLFASARFEALVSADFRLSALTQADLEALVAGAPRLSVLDVSATDVTDLSPLAALQDLATLRAVQTGVEDASVAALLQQAPSLSRLDLCRCAHLTGTFASMLTAPIPALRVLLLGGCAALGNNVCEGIGCWMRGLESLSLDSYMAADAHFGDLQELAGLETLQLAHTKITTPELAAILRACPGLRTLALARLLVFGDALALAARLESLSLANVWIDSREAGLPVLVPSLESLQSLHLTRCRLVPESFLAAPAVRLRRLSLVMVDGLDAAGFAAVVAHCGAGLEALDLSHNGAAVTDEVLTTVAEACPELKTLSLASALSVTDAGCAALAARVTGLRALDLTECRSLVRGFVRLAAGNPGLTSVELAGVRFNDAHALALAQGLKEIRTLDVSRTQVGDVGLLSLAQHCASLETLKLRGCRVSDAGLAHLGGGEMPLCALDLGECSEVSDGGVSRLVAAIPTLFRGRVRLAGSGASAAVVQREMQRTRRRESAARKGQRRREARDKHSR